MAIVGVVRVGRDDGAGGKAVMGRFRYNRYDQRLPTAALPPGTRAMSALDRPAPPPFPSRSQPRGCTPCTACCVHLPVPAGLIGPGAKPAGVACAHLGATGCRNYLCRAEVCSRFRCAWLADPGWPAAWRPDLVGLLCLREWIGGELPAALVYEIRPGAIQSPEAARLLAELRETTAVVTVVDFQKRSHRLLGAQPPAAWSAAEEAAIA